MSDRLRHNANLVDALGSSLRSGSHGLDTVPALLKRVLQEESWREFVTQRGDHVKHERFAEFVTTLPLAGLGTSVDLVCRIVASEPEAADLLDRALQRPVGANQYSIGEGADNVNTLPDGNSKAQALRRLRKDAPELHADVLSGRLSAHAAMVRAGFRRRTLSVPIAQPDAAASVLRKHMSPEDLTRLIELLKETP
jgi:hypothetical protein